MPFVGIGGDKYGSLASPESANYSESLRMVQFGDDKNRLAGLFIPIMSRDEAEKFNISTLDIHQAERKAL